MSKQLKISDLKRVVNVDVINKYADILKNESNKDEKQIEDILKKLSEKTPSREVLLQTRLGFILRDLSAREGLSIHLRDRARDLRTKWKEFHKNLMLAPKYDVKCDKPTTEHRENAKKSLANQFKQSHFEFDVAEHLVADLEFSIFKRCDTLINTRYFNTVKKCLRVIADNNELCKRFLSYDLDSEEFLTRAFKFHINTVESNSRNEDPVTLD
jgi:hypothetical protein